MPAEDFVIPAVADQRNWRDRAAAAELQLENVAADLRVARAELDELRALVVRQALELARRGFP